MVVVGKEMTKVKTTGNAKEKTAEENYENYDVSQVLYLDTTLHYIDIFWFCIFHRYFRTILS